MNSTAVSPSCPVGYLSSTSRDRRHPLDGPASGADIVEVAGSHVIMISQPQAVTDQILNAAGSAGAA
jgi:hypothetical protein